MNLSENSKISLKKTLKGHEASELLTAAEELKKRSGEKTVEIDLSGTDEFDTIGVSAINYLQKKNGFRLILNEKLINALSDFEHSTAYSKETKSPSLSDNITESVISFFHQMFSFTVLTADIFYYSLRALVNREGRKKGSVYQQILLMGNNAVPIVSLLSFLIGLILSLQSAAQLRQFGANIYLVDLIVIGMILEMGPMITAVIVAGRSGSAIAAEISTMKITEELDALKVMALNPLKYVVSPKMLAMSVSLPILTIIANMVGIFGGFIIGVLYLDLSADIFINRAVSVMTVSFWRQSMLKSILFSWLIVLIGSHFGFNVKGGAEGVGKAATSSVVASIFAVIITDALLSLIFYYEW